MAENVKEGKITAQLYDLAITERKDDYSARIVTRESRSLEDLARLAVAKRTDLNLNTLINAYNLLKEVAIQELINGSNVEFGLGIDGLVINGVFIGEGAQFDPKEHKLSISHSLIAEVREALKRVQINVIGVAKNDPLISKVYNVTTGEWNQTITPGGGLNLEGIRIRIEGDVEGVGLRFRPFDGGEAVEVPMTSVLINKPSAISLIVPSALAPGDYNLELTTQYSPSNALLKQPRSTVFQYVLNVPQPAAE